MEWLMRFTDDELEAIYTAVELAPPRAEYEERWEAIIDKVCADKIGPGARPVGAVGAVAA
jgi:hypothetical protein